MPRPLERMPLEYREPLPRALITIDGRQWPGVLRRRTWNHETETWRWDVDLVVDGRHVTRSVGQAEIQLLDRD